MALKTATAQTADIERVNSLVLAPHVHGLWAQDDGKAERHSNNGIELAIRFNRGADGSQR